MQRTPSGLRSDPATRLADLERRRPEWQTWLTLLGEAQHALDDAGWRNSLASRESRVGGSLDVPLLHERTLQVDTRRVHRLVRHLLAIAASGDVAGGGTLGSYRPSKAEAVALLLAAVKQEPDELASLAEAAGVDRGALGSVAHLAAYPLIQACGRLLKEQVPSFWPHGYCPICAAWPTLAERRGLDRTRRMRCGRCSGEWEVQWLCCVYCGERDHEKLGSLVPDGSGEVLKVETCASCKGYLKSVATLQGIPPFDLLLQDLETVELDLVALERGYSRPERSGFGLEVYLA